MASELKGLIILLCLAAIGGLFLPQVEFLSGDFNESVTYVTFDSESKGQNQGMGITILVLLVLTIITLLVNANVISLVFMTAGTTLAVYSTVSLINYVSEYKEYMGSALNYGIGFYLLSISILISFFTVLFNFNKSNDSYYSYSNSSNNIPLNRNASYYSNNYNQAVQSMPQSSYGQVYSNNSFNNYQPQTSISNASINNNIFNQSPVVGNFNSTINNNNNNFM